MIGGREAIMTALFNLLTGAITTNFTGDTVKGSEVVSNITQIGSLFLGLPVFGPGIPSDAVIGAIDVGANEITLAAPATANGTGVALTTGFQTTGRRVLLWSKVAAQPALFLRNVDDEDVWDNPVLPKTTLDVEVWIYSRAGANPDLAPGVGLNNLVDAVRAAFKPDNPMTRTLTLGGLVQWCRIEGKSDFDPGDLDGQAKAVVPVKILVP